MDADTTNVTIARIAAAVQLQSMILTADSAAGIAASAYLIEQFKIGTAEQVLGDGCPVKMVNLPADTPIEDVGPPRCTKVRPSSRSNKLADAQRCVMPFGHAGECKFEKAE